MEDGRQDIRSNEAILRDLEQRLRQHDRVIWATYFGLQHVFGFLAERGALDRAAFEQAIQDFLDKPDAPECPRVERELIAVAMRGLVPRDPDPEGPPPFEVIRGGKS